MEIYGNFNMIFGPFFKHFFIHFSILSKTLPEAIFGGPKCRSRLKSAILEPFWDPPGGAKNDPWGDIFGPKGSQNLRPLPAGPLLEPTWARHGAENAPKRPKNRFLSILDGFWTDFWWIFMILEDFLKICCIFLHTSWSRFSNISASIFSLIP